MLLDLLFFMDPLDLLAPATDTSLAVMRTAQGRGQRVRHGTAAEVLVDEDFLPSAMLPSELAHLDVLGAVLLRGHRHFDADYLRLNWLLDRVEQDTLSVNAPRSQREALLPPGPGASCPRRWSPPTSSC